MADKTTKQQKTAGRPPRGSDDPRSRANASPGPAQTAIDAEAAADVAAERPNADGVPNEGVTNPRGATGWSKGGAEPERPGIPQPHGGTLTPHAPGANGGVHRGPDRFLRVRRNTVRVMLFSALAEDGPSVEDLRRTRKHRKGAPLVPYAMLQHCKQGYKNIAKDAALGKLDAYGPFLRMMDHAHTILQPEKDELVRESAPRPATFVRPSETPAEHDEAASSASPPTTPGTLIGPDGKEYVT